MAGKIAFALPNERKKSSWTQILILSRCQKYCISNKLGEDRNSLLSVLGRKFVHLPHPKIVLSNGKHLLYHLRQKVHVILESGIADSVSITKLCLGRKSIPRRRERSGNLYCFWFKLIWTRSVVIKTSNFNLDTLNKPSCDHIRRMNELKEWQERRMDQEVLAKTLRFAAYMSWTWHRRKTNRQSKECYCNWSRTETLILTYIKETLNKN